MKILKVIGLMLVVIVMTIVTQIGGIVLILILPFFLLIDRKAKKGMTRMIIKPLAFIGLYLLITFAIVPIVAKPLGRVPMPVWSDDRIKPLNVLTCLLNRHYIRPEMLRVVQTIANKMDEKHPGTVVAYLDANFPFVDKFPLFPHLSHYDGKKLDLAFLYIDSETREQVNNDAPSFIGYGVCEAPLTGEIDKPSDCTGKGYWQYNFLQNLVPQGNKDKMIFDHKRTKSLLTLFAQNDAIGKIFIEPHLKARMNLNYDKIRFHGCQSVRHDDHIHVQLR